MHSNFEQHLSNYLRKPTFSDYKKPNRRHRSVLSPYTNYILERWNSGCLDTRRLFEEIQRQGYRGSYATVARYTQRLRQAQGLPPRQCRPRGSLPKVAKPKTKPLTARGAAWLVLRRPPSLRTAGTKSILAASLVLNTLMIGSWVVFSIRYR